MKLGENILKLRKQQGLSQEQLGEQIGVTRQTISNWELEETTPNPEQLKLLSKVLNISVDELIDNDTRKGLETKVSNTEKLAGIIIKGLKVIGILFILFLIIDIIAFIMFTFIRKEQTIQYSESIELICSLNSNEYSIEIGTDGYFSCSNCPISLQKELKDSCIDSNSITVTEQNINHYFKNNNGICE